MYHNSQSFYNLFPSFCSRGRPTALSLSGNCCWSFFALPFFRGREKRMRPGEGGEGIVAVGGVGSAIRKGKC